MRVKNFANISNFFETDSRPQQNIKICFVASGSISSAFQKEIYAAAGATGAAFAAASGVTPVVGSTDSPFVAGAASDCVCGQSRLICPVSPHR